MKILHTADWHLGQKFMFRDRYEEQKLALDWLLDTIKKENIELLVVAGDIFDTMNPPNNAKKLYYDFLISLKSTTCRHVVIIGGNHDSPTFLNAPSELLKFLNIHVVGCATGNIHDEIIKLKNEDDELEGIIAAVPFLRDQDIRHSIAGETTLEREERVRQGIYNHYHQIAELVTPYIAYQVPLIATGHLYATGATAADPDRQKNIYVGNIENIDAEEFPAVFDYIALGHIHKAQIVGEEYHIRYAGSMIPLSFKEKIDQQSVYIFEIKGRQLDSGIRMVYVPTFRKLETISGTYEKITRQLDELGKEKNDLQTWVKVELSEDDNRPNIDQELKAYCKDYHLEILEVRISPKHKPLVLEENEHLLYSLESPKEIFKKRLDSKNYNDKEMEELEDTYLSLMDWMQEQEKL